MIVNIFIEFATYYVLLFDSPDMLDMLGNFAVVIMIVQFGNFFYMLKPTKNLKAMITDEKFEKLFTWEVTTSKSANHDIPDNELAPESILDKELAE